MSDVNDEQLRAWYAPIASREPRDRRSCPPPEHLQQLVHREGAESARLAVLDHVMSCGACRKEFDMLNALVHAKTETEASARGSRIHIFGSRPVRWAVTAIAASVALAVSVQVIQHRHQPDVLRDAEQKTPFSRTHGTTGSYPVSLITPTSATINVASGVTFSWHPTPGALRYTVEVLDVDGAAVFSTSTNDTAVVFPNAAQKLNTSTHYQWWVRAANASGVEQRSELRELRVRE